MELGNASVFAFVGKVARALEGMQASIIIIIMILET
jgi:hypothetical protein